MGIVAGLGEVKSWQLSPPSRTGFNWRFSLKELLVIIWWDCGLSCLFSLHPSEIGTQEVWSSIAICHGGSPIWFDNCFNMFCEWFFSVILWVGLVVCLYFPGNKRSREDIHPWDLIGTITHCLGSFNVLNWKQEEKKQKIKCPYLTRWHWWCLDFCRKSRGGC